MRRSRKITPDLWLRSVCAVLAVLLLSGAGIPEDSAREDPGLAEAAPEESAETGSASDESYADVRTARTPTLFHNDEAWYKDAVEPLILEDGVPYVPAEFFALFADVSYTVPAEGNLLFSGRNGYVSVLTRDGSSAVNGEIGYTVGVFRDGSSYYVEAEPVCAAVGLTLRLETRERGDVIARITDGNQRQSMEQLLSAYEIPESEGVRTNLEDRPEPAKRLFIFCTSPEDQTEYNIESELERYGMRCTVFLWHDASLEQILAGQSYGAYGVATTIEYDTAGALTEADERIRQLTRRRTRWTLTTEDPESDALLRNAGFYPLVPDFTVTNLTALDTMMTELEDRLDEQNEVSVFLTDSWKGTVAVSLLRALLDNHPDWAESNLAG